MSRALVLQTYPRTAIDDGLTRSAQTQPDNSTGTEGTEAGRPANPIDDIPFNASGDARGTGQSAPLSQDFGCTGQGSREGHYLPDNTANWMRLLMPGRGMCDHCRGFRHVADAADVVQSASKFPACSTPTPRPIPTRCRLFLLALRTKRASFGLFCPFCKVGSAIRGRPAGRSYMMTIRGELPSVH